MSCSFIVALFSVLEEKVFLENMYVLLEWLLNRECKISKKTHVIWGYCSIVDLECVSSNFGTNSKLYIGEVYGSHGVAVLAVKIECKLDFKRDFMKVLTLFSFSSAKTCNHLPLQIWSSM